MGRGDVGDRTKEGERTSISNVQTYLVDALGNVVGRRANAFIDGLRRDSFGVVAVGLDEIGRAHV